MRKKLFLLILVLLSIGFVAAQVRMMYVYQSNGYVPAYSVTDVDSVTFSENASSMQVYCGMTVQEYLVQEIDSLVFDDPINQVQVAYQDNKVMALNPFVNKGVDINVSGANVVIRSESESKDLVYELQGMSQDGMCKIYSSKKYVVRLNGLSLTHKNGPALNCQSKKACTLLLVDGTQNTLADGKGYSLSSGEGEDQKAAFFAEGQILFTGGGLLTVEGNNNHAICSDDYLSFEQDLGTVVVNKAVNDGLHGKDGILIEGGILKITSSGDAVDAGDYLIQNGGNVTLTVLGDSIKKEGLKADTALTVNDGILTVENKSAAGKCLKTDGVLRINGGTFYLTNTGTYCLESGEISAASGMKSDSLILVTGGDITLINTSAAGKGISSDGILKMTSGVVKGTFSGDGVAFTNVSNEQDVSSSKCLASDGDMYLYGGSVVSSSSGKAGKGIVSKGELAIGNTDSGPTLDVITTGAKLTTSSSGGETQTGGGPGGGGWNPGRPGGGGDMDSSNGSSPKAIKSMKAMTIHNGTVMVKTNQDGGEGLESKTIMTVNGGTIEATTYDDALNAATDLTVNGGFIYAYATNNDGLDSNGTFHFNGGVTIASGTSAPEEGFDCDNNSFVITGGILIGTGGGTSTPTVTTQKYVKFSNVRLTSGQIMRLSSSSSSSNTDAVLTYRSPRTLSGATVLMSSPLLKSGTVYYLYTGASVEQGMETFHGYYENATATGGSSGGSCTAR